MPYNTTAIPPRKEPTGQTQLPLTRVKKIIAQDQDINICSNNAAFVITVATELFIQHIAQEALKQAKLERKPRRNIQYKDVANAIHHQDNLEFLVDVVPKTVKYKEIKAQAAATRAQLRGERQADGETGTSEAATNGKKHKSNNSRTSLDGRANIDALLGATNGTSSHSEEDQAADPNDQLQQEASQARGDGDVDMTG